MFHGCRPLSVHVCRHFGRRCGMTVKGKLREDLLDSTASVASTGLEAKRIELVPARIHKHLFGDKNAVPPNVASDEIYSSLELPNMKGANLLEHFENLGKEQIAEYRMQLDIAASMETVPEPPMEWAFEAGWTKYSPEKGSYSKVEYPDEKLLFFDVEVCVSDGQIPTLAVALSPSSWYSWCSERLVNNEPVPVLYRPRHLIPLEPKDGSRTAKVVVGHNVAYDRSRVREQYYRQQSATRFWDTMSMAIPIYGMADHQLLLYEKNDLEEDERGHSGWVDDWKARVCKNALSSLHEKLCGKTSKLTLNKSMQSFFVKEPIEEIRSCFQDLVRYCSEDVIACFEIYKALYPEFVKRFPHPVTWQGMLEMSNVYLPVTSNWRRFYSKCEAQAANENTKAARGVLRAAQQLVKQLGKKQDFKNDPWMWSEDWRVDRRLAMPAWYISFLKHKKLGELEIDELTPSDIKLKSRVIPRLFGLCWGIYPLHFKADKGWGFLVHKVHLEKSDLVPQSSKAALRRGEEVDMPVRAILELIRKNIENGIGEVVVGNPDCSFEAFNFHKLPHPKGAGANVGDPLAKDFYTDIEEGVLRPTRYAEEFAAMLAAKNTTRFWGNYRDRFHEQVTVWLDDEGKEGAIAPSVIPAGTVTRRAVHKLWLTATNPKDDKMIGTDLKSMVECPQGWYIVGADVDSQEQWIAALLGDCAVGKGIAGATPFSRMLLAGSKSNHSDLHSVVAKTVGISRDKAKVLNYARLYGSGLMHAIDFLKQSGLSAEQAQIASEKLFATTKGRQNRYLELSADARVHFEYFLTKCPEKLRNDFIYLNGQYYLPDYRSRRGKLTELFEDWISKEVKDRLEGQHRENFSKDILLSQLYENDCEPRFLYSGGFESDTFNYLELVVGQAKPRTPVLDCRLGYAFEPLPKGVPDREYFLAKYKRSVINWVVQSSAVDFLHLLLTCMRWLCEEYDINARFIISIHDEIRYMVHADDRYRCALALALSNMYVRAMISQKLGINQLPISVAFFSLVDVDTILRKEASTVCKTPEGRLIPPGETLDMDAILKITSGSLSKR